MFINVHGLTSFIVCSRIPSRFVDDVARISGSENPEYYAWLQRDQLLLSWLQLTLSSEILSCVLGCTLAHELWGRLFQYFHKQTCVHARQLHVELCAMKLNSLSNQDYLLKIRLIVDALASIGDPLPVSHHIDVILEGLPSEFALVVSVIERKFGIMDIDEVEILLVSHELRLTKFKKYIVPDIASPILTHVASDVNTSAYSNVVLIYDSSAPPYAEPDYNSFGGGRNGRGGGRNGRGRGGQNSTLQCRVCSKFGHSTLKCWHRYNQQFQASTAGGNSSAQVRSSRRRKLLHEAD